MLLEIIRNSKKELGGPIEETGQKLPLVMLRSEEGSSPLKEQNLGGTVMTMVKWGNG